MSAATKGGREVLRLRFADAATRVSELYREATNAYDRGYRDALLHVCCHLSPSSGASGAEGAEELLRFVRGELRRCGAVAAARSSGRRRRRSTTISEESERHTPHTRIDTTAALERHGRNNNETDSTESVTHSR